MAENERLARKVEIALANREDDQTLFDALQIEIAKVASLIRKEAMEECAKIVELISHRREPGFYYWDFAEAQHDKILGEYIAKRIREQMEKEG